LYRHELHCFEPALQRLQVSIVKEEAARAPCKFYLVVVVKMNRSAAVCAMVCAMICAMVCGGLRDGLRWSARWSAMVCAMVCDGLRDGLRWSAEVCAKVCDGLRGSASNARTSLMSNKLTRQAFWASVTAYLAGVACGVDESGKTDSMSVQTKVVWGWWSRGASRTYAHDWPTRT
jgi:hypothetical protein